MDVAGAIPGLFSFGTDTTGCAVTDGMLVEAEATDAGAEAATAAEAATGAEAGAEDATVDATGAGAAGATIEAAVEAAVDAADCTAATDDAIADCTAATEDAIADSMAGAVDAGTDVVDAIPGRFSFGAAAAEAAEAAEAAAAAFDFTIPGFAIPGFFFGRLARISSRSFISAWPNSF